MLVIIYNVIFFGLLIFTIRQLQEANAIKNGYKKRVLLNTWLQATAVIIVLVLSLFGQAVHVFAAIFLLIVGLITWIRKSKVDALEKELSDMGDFDIDSVEGTVRVQLHCYKGLKKKYSREKPTQLYIRLLSQRPGYDKESIKWVLNQARSPAAHGRYGLRSVVSSMLLQEGMQEKGDLSNQEIQDIVDTVERIIPAQL